MLRRWVPQLPSSPATRRFEPFVGEEREYAHLRAAGGASVMMRFGIRAPLEPPTVPHGTQKLHARADAGCAGDGLRPFAAVRKADAEQASTEK
jgi:hypothetical protein